MKKRLVMIIVIVLVVCFVASASTVRFNDGEQNLSNTMKYFAKWVLYFGLASMFIGAITVGMAYSSDNPSIRQKGLAMLVIGAACTQSELILKAVGLIV